MNQLLENLRNKISAYMEQALLEIIYLHELGISQAEFTQIMPDPYAVHSEARYHAKIMSAKHLDTVNYSPRLD